MSRCWIVIIAWISYFVQLHHCRDMWVPLNLYSVDPACRSLFHLLLLLRIMVSAHGASSKPYNKHERRITTQSDALPTRSLSQSFRMVSYLEPSLCSSSTPSIQQLLDSLELADLGSRQPSQLSLLECYRSWHWSMRVVRDQRVRNRSVAVGREVFGCPLQRRKLRVRRRKIPKSIVQHATHILTHVVHSYQIRKWVQLLSHKTTLLSRSRHHPIEEIKEQPERHEAQREP